MQPVKLHMHRRLPVQNAALLAPNTQKTKYAVMMHPIQAACGYKATCTECCAVDPQWVAQWKSWRCPGRCWQSTWLHTTPQCPQALSCIQKIIVTIMIIVTRMIIVITTIVIKHSNNNYNNKFSGTHHLCNRPYREAPSFCSLLWRNKTCPART